MADTPKPDKVKDADKPKEMAPWKRKTLSWLGLFVLFVVAGVVAAIIAVKTFGTTPSQPPVVQHTPSTITESAKTTPPIDLAAQLETLKKDSAERDKKLDALLEKFGGGKQPPAAVPQAKTPSAGQAEDYGQQGDPRTQQPQGGYGGQPEGYGPQGFGQQMHGRRGGGRQTETPLEAAARAYESLGPAPSDAPLKNHQKVAKKSSRSFTCPDGSPGQLVKKVDEDGTGRGHARWFCP